MTLSDPFCVDRYRDEFLDLMRSGTVDIVFANESELKSLYQTASFEAGLELIRRDCKLAAVTRSERGSVVVRGDETVPIEAIEIEELVDTTGAGDLYAAGFLYGYTAGRSLADCGALGSLAAGLVIQQIGPRPQASLRQAAQQRGLL
jgi:sugar/nucleoside kinase (ribokinase family)